MNAPEVRTEVFSHLDATYIVAQESDPADLVADASRLLESAAATVTAIADELEDDDSTMFANPNTAGAILYGAYHQIMMATSAIDAALSRLPTSVEQARPTTGETNGTDQM